MGKKDKSKKGKGAEKTAAKTMKKQQNKLKKELAAKGEEDLEQIIKEIEDAERKKNAIVEELLKDGPSRRANFSMNVNPDKDEIIFFGGEYFNGQKTFVYGDLLIYNIKKKNWLKIQAPGAAPPRCAHQAVMTAGNGGQLWIYGGEYASPSQSQFYHYKDLWVFHLKTKTWEKIGATLGPSARSGHRMVLCRKQLVVFGGYHDNGIDYKYFNDVHIFDIDNRTWKKIEPQGNGPAPRSGCQMVALSDGRILIMGGYSKAKVKKDVDKGQVHKDSFLLVPDKHDPTGSKWKWQSVKITGNKPSPRTGIAVTTNPTGNKAYFFGGVCDDEEDDEVLLGNFYNDLYCLDLDKLVFSSIILEGKRSASDRKKHKEEGEAIDVEEDVQAMSISEEKNIDATSSETSVVHDDGVFTVTIGPSTSSVQQTTDAPGGASAAIQVTTPSPRMGSSMAMKHGILYLYGGIVEDGDKQYTLNDMFALDSHKLEEWEELIHDEDAKYEWMDSESEGSDIEEDSESNEDVDDEDGSEEEMDTD